MATVWVQPPYATATTINAANDYVLPAAGHGRLAKWKLSLVSSSFVGSITIKARASGTGNAPVAVPYTKFYLNGAVGDGSKVSTAITTDSEIEVDSEGMDVSVSVTSYTSGSMALTARPVLAA